MNAKPTRPHPPMITLGDIYYTLFRHKWKILIISAMGLIAAMIIPLVWPRSYESSAELLIKYVLDNRLPSGPDGNMTRMTLPDAAGRNIINTELHILTSLDLAQEVATNIGTAKILGKEGNVLAAAARIHNNMTVEVPPNSDIIRIVFKHSDPLVVQQVLQQVIATYLDRHAEIHRPGGAYDDFLQKETDHLKVSLQQTEDSLRSAKTNLNIVSLEDSQKVFGEQMTKIQQDIFDADAELAEHEASVTEMSKHAQVDQLPTNSVNTADADSVPAEKTAEYKRVCGIVEMWQNQQKELSLKYLPESSKMQDIQARLDAAEKQKKQMETETPALLVAKTAAEPKAPTSKSEIQNKLIDEMSRIAALQRKIQVLTNHLAYIQGRAAAVDASASTITELEQTRNLERKNYEFYVASLDASRVEEALGPGKGSNINVIQSPSTPFLDNSKMKKASMGVAAAGIFLALALAFLIELYFDHTLKRPSDIEARLGVPLFLSIPYRNGKGKPRLLSAPDNKGLVLISELLGRSIVLNGSKTTIGRLPENSVPIEDGSISQHHCEIFTRDGEVVVKDLGSTNGTYIDGQRIVEGTLKADQTLRVGNVEFLAESQNKVKDLVVAKKGADAAAPWDARHALRPFYDTLRDRLITYFEVKNLTHNPKLVALTSCGDRAGVTSTAAGLAAALSETGDGNVLLVDMNVESGAAHHFYKGNLSCGIDEALTKDKRHEARVQDNLYVVTESSNEDSLPRVLPKRFNSLVSKLKASDFDYIIFDMPPMSQISITPRLARYMDMVMVVVESEKTDRDVVQRAVNMLTETRANVGVILNKRKKYVPERIQQEL